MENILNTMCNICAIMVFGSFFYLVYAMNKQDKETGWLDDFKKPSSK